MAAANKREIASRAAGGTHRNQTVLCKRTILETTEVRLELDFADYFRGAQNHQLFAAHKSVCTLGRIFLQVVRRDILVAQQFQVMAKPDQRQGIRKGTAIAAFGFGHKVAAKVPKERGHLLVSGPVVLYTELERHNRFTHAVGHLPLGNRAEHPEKFRVRFYFAIVQAKFQPDAFVRKKSAHVQEPGKRIHNRVAPDMRSLHRLRIKTARIHRIQQKIYRGNQPLLCKERNPARSQLQHVRVIGTRTRFACKRLAEFGKRRTPIQKAHLHRNPALLRVLAHKLLQCRTRVDILVHHPQHQRVRPRRNGPQFGNCRRRRSKAKQRGYKCSDVAEFFHLAILKKSSKYLG